MDTMDEEEDKEEGARPKTQSAAATDLTCMTLQTDEKFHGWTAETRGGTGDATTSQRTRCRTRTRTVLVDVEKGGGPWETLVQTSITSTTEVLFPPVHLLVNIWFVSMRVQISTTLGWRTGLRPGQNPLGCIQVKVVSLIWALCLCFLMKYNKEVKPRGSIISPSLP